MTPWTFWIIFSAVLAVAEMMTGTFYLLVLSVGALAGAATALITPVDGVQITVAALVSAVGFVILHKIRPVSKGEKDVSANPDVNMDIGTIVHLAQIDVEGQAHVAYRGALWSARVEGSAPEMGTDYRISRVEGNVLVLQKVSK